MSEKKLKFKKEMKKPNATKKANVDGELKLAKENKMPKKQKDFQPRAKKLKKPLAKANEQENETAEEEGESPVPAIKRKLPVKKEEIQEDAAEPEQRLASSNINKAIFGIFSKLQSQPNASAKNSKQSIEKHVKKMIDLLSVESDLKKRTATCAYALKRLVRCTGADDKDAVVLNACYINSILRRVPGLDPIELLNVLKRELHMTNQHKGKEESLAGVGQLITAFAILESQHFLTPSPALIEAIFPILVAHLKGREYLVTMCANIIADSLTKINADCFEKHVWPLLQPVLTKPIAGQNVHGCDLLLAVHLSYPKLLTLKQLGATLWRKQEPQYAQLFELYLKCASIQDEGVYARLGQFLADSGEQLLTAWQQHIEKELPLAHNAAKAYVIQTLSFILLNYNESNASNKQLEQLFGMENLVSLLLQQLTIAKQRTGPKTKPAQLQLRSICHKFETALLISFQHQLKLDSSKLNIVFPLLQTLPQLDLVMKTPHLTQHLFEHMQSPSLEQINAFYIEQFTSQEEHVGKLHREQCLKQLQQLQLHLTNSDRFDFLMQVSLFHMDEKRQPCVAAKAALYSRQMGPRCEEVLLGGLIHKLDSSEERLQQLSGHLRPLLRKLNEQLIKPNLRDTLRAELNESLMLTWKEILIHLDPPGKGKPKLQLIFDTVIQFLGLALFMPTCGVSKDLVTDLAQCRKDALGTKKQRTQDGGVADRWQDVLTDVLVQLLLQTGQVWRSFVNIIATALMPHLSRANLEQMLQRLDMSKNPLCTEMSDDEGEEDGDEEIEEEEEEIEEVEEIDEDETSESEPEQSSDDDEDGEEENDDDATNLELIRENVRLALLNDDNDKDDASSVDWNDVDEATGERLNLALESAFHALKPHSQNNKSKRPTKSERIANTTLLHFRIRVLDLVDRYVAAHPQLDTMLDALNSVYQVYRISSSHKGQQPLSEASKKVLRRLLTQKIDAQPDKTTIVDGINQLMTQELQEPEKAARVATKGAPKVRGDLATWRDKCVAYLVSQFNEPEVTKTAIWPLLQSYVQDWITHRNSPHTMATFDALFLSQWNGIGQLAISFSSELGKTMRNMRRMQILELLVKHSHRIKAALADDKQAAKKLTANLAKCEPTGDRDRKLMKKLLAQLQKPLTTKKGDD